MPPDEDINLTLEGYSYEYPFPIPFFCAFFFFASRSKPSPFVSWSLDDSIRGVPASGTDRQPSRGRPLLLSPWTMAVSCLLFLL